MQKNLLYPCGRNLRINRTIEVTYLLDDPNYCKKGYVIMAIKNVTSP